MDAGRWTQAHERITRQLDFWNTAKKDPRNQNFRNQQLIDHNIKAFQQDMRTLMRRTPL
jgi:hypothetical protein